MVVQDQEIVIAYYGERCGLSFRRASGRSPRPPPVDAAPPGRHLPPPGRGGRSPDWTRLAGGIGSEVQDEARGDPQRDDRTLPPAMLLQPERFEPHDVAVETQRLLEASPASWCGPRRLSPGGADPRRSMLCSLSAASTARLWRRR